MSSPSLALPVPSLEVLRLLIVGVTRDGIAHRLHISERKVDSCIQQIKQALGTSQRLCLGVWAVRRALVPSQHPVAHALARRRGAGWVIPHLRQLEVLARLADGASVEEVARQIGMGASTVRGDLTRLARANGAQGMIHLGALAESLGWLCQPDPALASHQPA